METWFTFFQEHYADYGYPVLFAGVLLENAAIPVPGETAVLVAGFLASPAGGSRFELGWVIAVTFLAAVLGDNLGFWLGRRFARPRILAGRRFLILTPTTLQLMDDYLARYGLWTVFAARFIAGLRVVGALAAGTAGMPWRRFLPANAAGALAWAITISLLGYFFGHSLHLLHEWLGRGALLLVGGLILLIGVPYLYRRFHKLAPGLSERLAHFNLANTLSVVLLHVVFVAVLVLLARHHQPTSLDERVERWRLTEAASSEVVLLLAGGGRYLGSLPVIVIVAAAMCLQIWGRYRPWREIAVVLWAVLAGEVVGWLVVALLHHGRPDVIHSRGWPDGFAGLLLLRATSVFGTLAYLVGRQSVLWGVAAWVLAALALIKVGLAVVIAGEQYPTEILLEYAAGGLVLLAGVWWLQGYSPALLTTTTDGQDSVREGGRTASPRQ
jgi:membrane protein DedA with SNARE-associated domain